MKNTTYIVIAVVVILVLYMVYMSATKPAVKPPVQQPPVNTFNTAAGVSDLITSASGGLANIIVASADASNGGGLTI